MSLLQISEPGQTPEPHAQRHAIGIDLGTTNSLVAVVRSGVAEALIDEHGEALLPSVVRYLSDGTVVVGAVALVEAPNDPTNTIASVKRLMGRGIEDMRRVGQAAHYEFCHLDEAVPRIRTVSGAHSPIEVSSEILKTLKQRADAALATDIHDAVITVPAYFDDAQRQATKDAARLAGLNVLRLLNEPTAAALAYGLDRNPEGVYAVYDLGGGTFDISILRLQRGVFEVLATAGDSALGGDDMDNAIAFWIEQQAGLADSGRGARRRLLRDARMAKEALTQETQTTLHVERESGPAWYGILTRMQLHKLVDPLVEKTLPPCRRALRDAGLTPADIQGVVMVGGATRMPRVREKVKEVFGQEPLVDIDPDKVVAIGAAIQADALVGNRRDDMLLLDVIPLSLGIEIMGGMTEKIIPRNSTIPVSRAQEFTTYKDGQTALLIHVVQGEREMVSDCRSLARFELRGIPPMTAGAARIRVTFQVDADGLLSVSARETTTGTESTVMVKPSYGLTDLEIERMLRESVAYAREDEAARQLREAQVEADQLLQAVSVALGMDGSVLLNASERSSIDAAMAQVGTLRRGTDAVAIRTGIKLLEETTREFASRRMDASVKRALAGHRLEDLSNAGGR